MKRFLTFCCALLGFGAMASADPSVGSNGVFDLSVAGNDGNASYYSYDANAQTCTFTFPYWVTTNNEDNDATHYASSTGASNVDVNKADATEAGMTEITETYEATEGDVYYKAALAWDCAGCGWWTRAYDVTTAGYNTITAVVNTDQQVKIVAQGSNWENAASDVKNVATAGTAEDVTLVVNLTTSNDVMSIGLVQLYFQNSVVGQIITVKSITFSYEGTDEPEPEVTRSVSLDLPALKQAIIDRHEESGYTLAGDGTTLTDEDGATVDLTADDKKCAIMPADLVASGNDFFILVNDVNNENVRYREKSGAHITAKGGNALSFTLENAGVITFSLCSTDETNHSSFTLADVEGNLIAIDDDSDGAIFTGTTITSDSGNSVNITLGANEYAILGNTAVTVSWTVDAGTYIFAGNPVDFGRAVRIYDITIEDASIDESTTETEIEGYLTVAMGSTSLLEDEATTIVVTENTDGRTTVAVPAELSILTMTVTDLSVTFTADGSGAFTDGVASFNLSEEEQTVESIAGTFVTTDEGVTTFESTIAVYEGISIVVSFTTEAPVVPEATWTLIEDQFDVTVPEGIGSSSNATVTITWAELENYEYLKVEAVTSTSSTSNSSFGGILATADWNNSIYTFENNLQGGKQDEVIFNIADLKAQCLEADANSTEVYFVFWLSDIEYVAIYASADYEPEAEAGTEEATPEAVWTLTDHTTVGYESITWDELEGYDAVKFVLYYDGAAHEGRGLGGIYSFADGSNAVYSWTGTADDPDVWIITVEDLKELVGGTDAGGFGYNTWSPVSRIEVYFGVYEGSEGWNNIAEVKSDVEAVEVARYNLMGQKISGAERGINIIVYSDGSAKKVLVK